MTHSHASSSYVPAIHPAESILRDTLDKLELSSGESMATHVMLGGFSWAEREEAKRALEIISEVPVPFEPRKVFDEQALPACWVIPGRRLAVSAPVHTDMNKDEVKRPWEKTNAKLDRMKKDVQPLYQALWCVNIGAPVSCASWDVNELTVAFDQAQLLTSLQVMD
jgi:hypothetical protein